MFERRIFTVARLLLISMALCMLSAPTSSQNDNCCFVNQQCETEEEWVSGYYAFHNNQCAAPSVQSPAKSASQQPQVQGYSQPMRMRQFSNPGRQGEQSRRSKSNRGLQPRRPQQPSSPEVQWETEDWHRCGFPCDAVDQDGPRVGIILDVTNPGTRWIEADDGTPVLVGGP